MRTKTKLIMGVLSMLLLIPTCMLAQQARIVNLSVNTEDIAEPSISSFANFGQTDGSTNEDFTILVKLGDTIIWQGISSSNPSEHVVGIKSINHVGGARLFDRNVLLGDGGTPERVIGIISEGRPGDEKKYNIFFRLSNKPGTFKIDPKIKVE